MIHHLKNTLAVFLALVSLGLTVSAQSRPYRLNDRQVRELLERIERRSQTFRTSLDIALDRSRVDGARREDEINRFVRDFTEATNRLRDRFNNRRAVESDVREVLNRAAFIDGFMRRERLDSRAERDWTSLRTELDQLARVWSINWRWDNQGAFPPGSNYANNRLTGTWRLNAGRSDDPRAAAERATLSGDRLTVRSFGARGSDYEVTFEPLDGGRSLRVTRSLYTERLNHAVTARSIYDWASDVAQLDLDRDLPDFSPGVSPSRGNFIVPDGTQLNARLNQQLSTKQTREGDRFTLNVTDPGQYRGAVIEGVVARSDRSGRVSGRADMTLDFERIRMRDGRTYNFAGTIDRVQLPNGETVRVSQEGNVSEDDSQTSRTVTRSAIGGAIGAIIGAIAGGGKGAAIGAAVGAGAGAGSIFIEGHDDLELPSGTEIFIRASSPR